MSIRMKTIGRYAFTTLVFILLITACSGSDAEGELSDADRVLTQAGRDRQQWPDPNRRSCPPGKRNPSSRSL